MLGRVRRVSLTHDLLLIQERLELAVEFFSVVRVIGGNLGTVDMKC